MHSSTVHAELHSPCKRYLATNSEQGVCGRIGQKSNASLGKDLPVVSPGEDSSHGVGDTPRPAFAPSFDKKTRHRLARALWLPVHYSYAPRRSRSEHCICGAPVLVVLLAILLQLDIHELRALHTK